MTLEGEYYFYSDHYEEVVPSRNPHDIGRRILLAAIIKKNGYLRSQSS